LRSAHALDTEKKKAIKALETRRRPWLDISETPTYLAVWRLTYLAADLLGMASTFKEDVAPAADPQGASVKSLQVLLTVVLRILLQDCLCVLHSAA
jgi:hypothetical protein